MSSNYSYTYIQIVTGGVGLMGNHIPSGILLSTILGEESTAKANYNLDGFIYGRNAIASSGDLFSIMYGRDNISTYEDLNSFIQAGTYTESNPFTYAQLIIGGAGLISNSITPDLKGTLIAKSRIESAEETLSGVIRPVELGETTLSGYIRSAQSGSLDLDTNITAFFGLDLGGAIRAQFSNYTSISGYIEPIPPVDISGTLYGVSSLGLSGIIEAVGPIDLYGTLIGVPKLDISGNVYGYDIANLSGTISGVHKLDLLGSIIATYSGYNNIIGNIQGFRGINISDNIYGYILPSISGQNSVSGTILGVSIKDLYGAILPYTSDMLLGEILGDMPGRLDATIEARGFIKDIKGYIIASKETTSNINSTISGQNIEDLYGYVESNTDILIGKITPDNVPMSLLQGSIYPSVTIDLSGAIIPETNNLLKGIIEAIQPETLLGIITPKVFYVDSFIPINTYNIDNLVAVINADKCSYSSDLSDLSVVIKGIESTGIYASIIGLGGQYAMTSDTINLALKSNIEIDDWIFLIADYGAYSENYLPILLVNSPISDLKAYIDGIKNSTNLTATITPKYIPPVARKAVDIGEWVNTKTGERKLLKIKFVGHVDNFYYSSDGNIVNTENGSDYLELSVETYVYEGSNSTSLLARKINTNSTYITNLEDFKSIDEAIKLGILRAAGELNTELGAYIEAAGTVEDVNASISGIDSRYIRDLGTSIVPVVNDPSISGNIIATGKIENIVGKIQSNYTGITSSYIQDINGDYYIPKLVLNLDNTYSVVLTKTTFSGTLSLDSIPDLKSSIYAVHYKDIDTTITGTI